MFDEQFTLRKVGKGWTCKRIAPMGVGALPHVTGWGGRPDLAIRDYRDQERRWFRVQAAIQYRAPANREPVAEYVQA